MSPSFGVARPTGDVAIVGKGIGMSRYAGDRIDRLVQSDPAAWTAANPLKRHL
ncbi:hypothetical protein SALB1_0362 [Salinisphaera sp. LB1]|nr:hypothetical protein SALB1_0362 [Salinisphaera sp. LB1]